MPATGIDAKLTVTDAPGDAAEAAIRDGLSAYNFDKAGYRDHRPLAILVRDPETGEAVGGLLGRTSFGLLYVDRFFLPESLRRQGLGSRIIAAAEEEGDQARVQPGGPDHPFVPGARLLPAPGLARARQNRMRPARPHPVPDDENLGEPIGAAARLGHRERQSRIASVASARKPSIAAGSVQRRTATRSFSGSIQVRLPPAPRAQ